MRFSFPCAGIHGNHLVPCPQQKIHRAIGRDLNGARRCERSGQHAAFIRRRRVFSGARKRCDHPGSRIDLSYAVVIDVADQDVIRLVEHNAVRLVELRLGGGATLATVAGDARSGSGGDDLGLHVDMPHDVAVTFGNKDIALAVKPNFVGRAQQRRLRRSAIARVAFRSRARNDINALRRQIQAQDSVAAEVRPIKPAIRANHDAVRIVNRCGICRSTVGR